MTVKERILALRVLDNTERDPDYAKHLGLTVEMKKINRHIKEKRGDSDECI